MTDRTVFEHTLQRLAETATTTKGEWRDPAGKVLSAILERGAVMAQDGGHPRPAAGRYKLRMKEEGSHFDVRYRNRCPWFRHMIEIDGVPHRDEILIHTGNKFSDSKGCAMTGTEVVSTPDGFQIPGGKSMAAFNALYPRLYADMAKGDVFVTIVDPA